MIYIIYLSARLLAYLDLELMLPSLKSNIETIYDMLIATIPASIRLYKKSI